MADVKENSEAIEWLCCRLNCTNKYLTLLAVVVVVIMIYLIFAGPCHCKTTDTFEAGGPGGFRYELETLEFVSADDRQIALVELDKVLRKDGIEYTMEQLSRLDNGIIIFTLEPESENELKGFKETIQIKIDPDYKKALRIVNKANALNPSFTEEERTLIYNLLVRYFDVKKTPIIIPLKRWSNAQLIDTFKKREMPLNSAFAA